MAVVYLTSQLKDHLQSIGIDPDSFKEEFEWWRQNWPANEYSSELFGKDGAYIQPKVDGKPYSLRHVHLQPIEPAAKSVWEAIARRLGRKTSDRHPIYFRRDDDAFLLIHILDEPTAHQVALMHTNEDKELMNTFAIIAENFDIYEEHP